MNAAKIAAVAAGIGAVLEAAKDATTGAPLFDEVYPLPPAVTLPKSATVLPTGGAGETYCDFQLTFDVVLVAAAGDYPDALAWLAGGIDHLSDALDADPTCGGVCDGIHVSSWGEFFTTSANGSNVLAVRVKLTPTTAT